MSRYATFVEYPSEIEKKSWDIKQKSIERHKEIAQIV